MPQPAKERLDILLTNRGLAPSRAKAQGMIMAGEVFVNGERVDKPGTRFEATVAITVRARPAYVSRGGDKLAAALDAFQISCAGRVAADVGASTGGFTDCLLQHGVALVYAIDVGYGQLADKLRRDERVVIMERTNARYLEHLPQHVSLVVVDASFISLRLLLPTIQAWLQPASDVVALIKPQFEAGKDDVGKGGVVRDSAIHQRVIQEIADFAQDTGFLLGDITRSPITGPAGNVEFLIWLLWQPNQPPVSFDLAQRIQEVL